MADEVKDPKAAGWKPDPSGRFAGRFWNGTRWTEHVVNRERVTSTDPIPYPPAQARRPVQGGRSAGETFRQLPRWARIALPVAIVVAIAAAVSLRGGDETPAPAATGAPAATAPATESIHAIGETARTGDFDVTVFGWSDPQTPGPFLKPEAGKHLVSVDVEVTNRTRTMRSFSSLLGFHLVDGENRQYDTSFGEIPPEAPDGDIRPGEARRGFVVFEVPDGTTGLRFRTQGDLAATGVLFTLS